MGEGRTELATVIDFLWAGDELVVARVKRLGCDTCDVPSIIHDVEQRGSIVSVLAPHVSRQRPVGHIMLTALGTVTQMNAACPRSASDQGKLGDRNLIF